MNGTGNTTGGSGFAKEDEAMRIWGKNTVIEDVSDETRTHKVLGALYEICLRFDLGKPIWLDANISEFKKTRRVHFRKDSFIEEIDFDSLELMVIEED